MESLYELASKRRSIRKYENQPVLAEDLEYFINTAVTAPSGCNSQCWHFVAVTNKDVIERLAQAVSDSTREFYGTRDDESFNSYIDSKCTAAVFFRNAPLVIAVFMTKLKYYDPRAEKIYMEKGYDHNAMMEKMSYPDVLSVGAAVEHLLLAVEEKGYGACWMNEPALAGKKANIILGVPEDYRLMSFIPIGRPAYTPRDKKMKPVNEIFKLIE